MNRYFYLNVWIEVSVGLGYRPGGSQTLVDIWTMLCCPLACLSKCCLFSDGNIICIPLGSCRRLCRRNMGKRPKIFTVFQNAVVYTPLKALKYRNSAQK